ncbi:Uncharacterized protein Fot_56519 [Forsythia ovata]|uniref:Uncharacterized protein n=1 Tax=Forsythia ovata TaxID=205694 RepID=A0ABD1NZS2_9LAMI
MDTEPNSRGDDLRTYLQWAYDSHSKDLSRWGLDRSLHAKPVLAPIFFNISLAFLAFAIGEEGSRLKCLPYDQLQMRTRSRLQLLAFLRSIISKILKKNIYGSIGLLAD